MILESASALVRPRVLLVEDDDAVRRSLQLLLQGRGFDVRAYASAMPMLAEASVADALYLVADYRLPDGDGIGILRALRRQGWVGQAVLITGHPSPALKDAAEAAGFRAVLEKPLRQHELAGAIAELVFTSERNLP